MGSTGGVREWRLDVARGGEALGYMGEGDSAAGAYNGKVTGVGAVAIGRASLC